MPLFKVNYASLQIVKFFETFEDGDIDEYRALLASDFFRGRERELLSMRDINGRTPLHMVCMKGYAAFARFLVEKHVSYGLSLHPLDKRRDTPLLLVSSHGLDQQDLSDEAENARFLENRFCITELLVENDPGAFAGPPLRKNNPLHWAIYRGDVKSGLFLFQRCPKLLLRENERGKTPLEIVFEKSFRKANKKRSRRLVKCILEEFLRALFSSDAEQLEPALREVVADLSRLKNSDHIYDTQRLVKRLFVLDQQALDRFSGNLLPLLGILKTGGGKSKAPQEGKQPGGFAQLLKGGARGFGGNKSGKGALQFGSQSSMPKAHSKEPHGAMRSSREYKLSELDRQSREDTIDVVSPLKDSEKEDSENDILKGRTLNLSQFCKEVSGEERSPSKAKEGFRVIHVEQSGRGGR